MVGINSFTQCKKGSNAKKQPNPFIITVMLFLVFVDVFELSLDYFFLSFLPRLLRA